VQGNETHENHVPYINLTKEFKNGRFTEYLVLHDTNEYMVEESDSLFSGGLRETVKREIIYIWKDNNR